MLIGLPLLMANNTPVRTTTRQQWFCLHLPGNRSSFAVFTSDLHIISSVLQIFLYFTLPQTHPRFNMSNNATAEAGELLDFPERNPAIVFPAILCGIGVVVLVGYIIWLVVLCFRGCIRARRLKKEKEKEQQNGGDVTIDIPLGELDPSGRAQSTAGGEQEVGGFPTWVDDEAAGGDAEIEGQAPTSRCSQSVDGG
jgi:hypothetical protein